MSSPIVNIPFLLILVSCAESPQLRNDRSPIISGPSLLNNVQTPTLIAHAGGDVQGHNGSNSLEALDESYSEGFRLIELDFAFTSDNRLVVTHDWGGHMEKNFGVPEGVRSYEEFLNMPMLRNLTQLTIQRLSSWLDEHPDAYIVIDVKGDRREGFRTIEKEVPERLLTQFIPQVCPNSQYDVARDLGYANIIISTYGCTPLAASIPEFIKTNPILAVTIRQIIVIETDLVAKLSDANVFTYTHTINSLEKFQKYRDLGVMGVYTDKLTPDQL